MLTVTLVAAAVVLFWHGVRRDDRRARRVAPIMLLLAMGLWLMSWEVTTPAETVTDQTRQLVNLASSPYDASKVAALFDAEAGVLAADGGLVEVTREPIVDALGRAVKTYHVERHWVTVHEVEVDGPRAATRFVVRTWLGGEYGGRPVRTEWQLIWKRTLDDQWRIHSVQWLELNGQDPPRGIIW